MPLRDLILVNSMGYVKHINSACKNTELQVLPLFWVRAARDLVRHHGFQQPMRTSDDRKFAAETPRCARQNRADEIGFIPPDSTPPLSECRAPDGAHKRMAGCRGG